MTSEAQERQAAFRRKTGAVWIIALAAPVIAYLAGWPPMQDRTGGLVIAGLCVAVAVLIERLERRRLSSAQRADK